MLLGGSFQVMRLEDDREKWSVLVRAAQAGSIGAWPPLVARFEDLAVAAAVGLCGDLDEAPDLAQEALTEAVRNISSLKDPNAFPAWLLTLVRTANNRRTRRRRLPTEPFDTYGTASMADPAQGPEQLVVAASEATQVRNAIEGLPEGERCVIALHYLAEMAYKDVAEFLGISVPAAKKRAWSARSRLQELLPMTTDALAAARPSTGKTFRDTIMVFQAIRTGDIDLLAHLVERDPTLANVSEDWSPAEGFESDLSFSERAPALVRAAGRGNLGLVRLLIEAGAEVDDACGCVDQESPLVAAVNIGAADVVQFLLAHGASPNATAFDGGSTALHVAVHRNRHDLVRMLLSAGVDPTIEDGNGRTVADWALLNAANHAESPDSEVLWTRTRAIDLFAPLRRGALVYIPPAYGLGAMRTIYSVVDALQANFWMVGFEHGPYKAVEFEQEVRESGTPSTIDLVAPGSAPDRRRQFAKSLDRLAADRGPKVVLVVPSPGHEHDVTIALPGLRADGTVLTTIAVPPFTPHPPAVPDVIPEGFDARITFDPIRARQRVWPAIDPTHTGVRTHPDPEHNEIASRAREALMTYALLDPTLQLPDPASFDDPAFAERAQLLYRYLSHTSKPFEHLGAEPAANTPIPELLQTTDSILSQGTPASKAQT